MHLFVCRCRCCDKLPYGKCTRPCFKCGAPALSDPTVDPTIAALIRQAHYSHRSAVAMTYQDQGGLCWLQTNDF